MVVVVGGPATLRRAKADAVDSLDKEGNLPEPVVLPLIDSTVLYLS